MRTFRPNRRPDIQPAEVSSWMGPRPRDSNFLRMENRQERWKKEAGGPAVCNIQHMAPRRIRQDNSHVENSIPPSTEIGRYDGRSHRRSLDVPSQHPMAINKLFLSDKKKSRPNSVFRPCMGVRHSGANPAHGARDNDTLRGGRGCIQDRTAIRPARLFTSIWKRVETNVVRQMKYQWAKSSL